MEPAIIIIIIMIIGNAATVDSGTKSRHCAARSRGGEAPVGCKL